jgi:hypothetical protein
MMNRALTQSSIRVLLLSLAGFQPHLVIAFDLFSSLEISVQLVILDSTEKQKTACTWMTHCI